MDDETVRMLEDLPADLLARGWRFVPLDSRAAQTALWHRAVYHRPFDDQLDTEKNAAAAIYDKVTRHQIVRVSTSSDHSLTWGDARRDAIQRMRTADAKRRIPHTRRRPGEAHRPVPHRSVGKPCAELQLRVNSRPVL